MSTTPRLGDPEQGFDLASGPVAERPLPEPGPSGPETPPVSSSGAKPTSWTSPRAILQQAPARFLLAGGFNTAVSMAVYVTLLTFAEHTVAYSVTFILGVGLSYLLNRYFVFGSTGGIDTLLLFPSIYVAQYLVGLLIVLVWVDILGFPAELAALAAVVVTIPITYIMSRWVFVTRHPRRER